MAMQGLLANSYFAQETASNNLSGSLATAAVFHVDALLAALAGTKE